MRRSPSAQRGYVTDQLLLVAKVLDREHVVHPGQGGGLGLYGVTFRLEHSTLCSSSAIRARSWTSLGGTVPRALTLA